MWYFLLHALSFNFCPGRDSRRTAALEGRTSLCRRLSRPPLPASLSQRVWSRRAADCTPNGLQRTNRTQYHPRLQSPRRGVSAARVLPTAHHARAGGTGCNPATAGVVTPESAHLRPPDQSVDLRVSSRGEFCPRLDSPARQPRSDSHGVAPPGGELATRQAVDYQSRSGLCPQKKARDRLIRLATSHPQWALGFEDETWWSRVAQPALHAWTPAQQPLRFLEHSVPSTDPDPIAVACYGLLVQQRTPQGVSQDHV